MRSILIADAAAQFLAYAAETVAPSTFDVYQRYLQSFVDAFAGRSLESITPAQVRTWGKRYHPMQAVQRLCSWAKKEERLIDVNPLEGMRKARRGRRIRVLAVNETAQLLRSASGCFRWFLVGMRETIARPGELRRATFADVRVSGSQPASDADLAGGRAFIFLADFKARDQRGDVYAIRVIPISPRLGRLLVRLRGRLQPGESHLFVNRFGKPWTVNAVICRLRRLREAGAIACDHRGENIVAYSLRHTGATKAICAGVDLATLAATMGHSDVRMTSRYVHLAPDHLGKSMNAITEAKTRSAARIGRLRLRRTRPDDVG